MLLLTTIRGCWRMRRRFLKPIARVCAILSVLFVGVCVYIFSGGKAVMEMEPGPQSFKYPQYNDDQLTQWPFLGVNPLLMETNETRKETKCELPKLEIFNNHVLPFYHPHKPMDCARLFNKKRNTNMTNNNTEYVGIIAFTVKNGRDLHQLVNMSLSCCYQPFATVDPGEGLTESLGSCVAIRKNVTVIPSGIDYIEVLCKNDNHQILYRDGFPLVHPPPAMLRNGSEINNRRLNIIVIGLDSTSQLNFQRFMPLSMEYLLSADMSAITLHGYSVVAIATRSNVFPMLSGLSKDNLEERCYRRNKNWNNCSKFVWEQASKRGYITNYAEDWQVFQYFYNASFAKPPTDYYFWPFAVKMKTFGKSVSSTFFCVGRRLAIEGILDFAQSVSEVAQKQNRPHFQFLWSGALSHGSRLNSLSLGDAHLVNTLKFYKETGMVNNTVIMILGDHGNSRSNYFRMPSGKIEYRLPVAHIVLPPWFKTKYPREYSNLVENSRKRTTSYDIYETLMDIMDLEVPQQKDTSSGNREKGLGISLFERIPESRYCTELGIRLELCNICHPKIQLNVSDPLVTSAAKVVVDKINSLTWKLTHPLCQKLGLFKVITAELWHPKDVVMELCKRNTNGSAPCTSFDNVEEVDNVNRVAIISLMLTTSPNAMFLADAKLIWIKNTSVSVNRKPDIIETYSGFDVAMRVDPYAETGSCAKKPEQRPFCMCKIIFV